LDHEAIDPAGTSVARILAGIGGAAYRLLFAATRAQPHD
jgi:hypothetical protein